MIITELEHLRKVLNPVETISSVTQCRIVAEALENETVGGSGDLADYLGLSKSNISKMVCAHRNLIQELKDWYGTTAIGVNTLYEWSRKTPQEQGLHFENAILLGT